MERCGVCGVPEDKANDFIELAGGDFVCGDCMDGGALPSRSDQMVFKRTGYTVERS